MEHLPPDLYVTLALHLDLLSSVRLSTVCKSLHRNTQGRDEWWRALARRGPLRAFLQLEEQRVADRLVAAPPQSVVLTLVKHPPLFCLVLRYNVAVSRDVAMQCIQAATGGSSLSVLFTALNIGHPWLNPAEVEDREGEVCRGVWREVKASQERLAAAASAHGVILEARVELLPYDWLPDQDGLEGSCVVQ